MTTDSEKPERPIGLWVVPILALVLGTLGSCGSTFGLGSLLVQDDLIAFTEQMAQNQPDQGQAELQREMNRANLEVAARWKIPSIAGQVVNLIASFGLIIAGILLFRWHPSAPMIFIGAAVLSIIADLTLGGVGVLVQRESMVAMEQVMATHGDLAADPNAQRMVSGVMRASGTFGLCWALGWLAAKLGCYLGGIYYLRKETVRDLFG